MKKTVVALAVLAASGAAFAQSSVTVYGRVDAAFGQSKDKISGVTSSKVFDGDEAGSTQSRIGFRGVEDLGGGLKATFKLEQRFFINSGAQDDRLFKGESTVGLEGGFGSVKLGRADTAFDEIHDLADSSNTLDSAFNPTKSVWDSKKIGVRDYSSRADNQVIYKTPTFGGFSAAVSHGFDNGVDGTKKISAINVRYKEGAVDVGVAYQQEKTRADASKDKNYINISGGYDFGVVRVSAGYEKAEQDKVGGNEDTKYALGVNVPMGNWDFGAGYAYSKTETAAGASAGKGHGFGLGVSYKLSKRTRVYAGYRDHKMENAAGVKQEQVRLYAVGMRHDF